MSNRKKVVDDAIHVGDWWIKGNKNKRAKGILYLPAEGEFKLEGSRRFRQTIGRQSARYFRINPQRQRFYFIQQREF